MKLNRRLWLITNITRTYSSSSKMGGNHYEALGLTPKATQNDIKSAYYKLSMQHHPDKSKEESSPRKFRMITEAYEVLGNVKLKKIYDKGFLQGDQSPTTVYHPEAEPDDPTLKFYKSRTNRHVVPTMDGKTPIYNFDAWAKYHYSDAFQRKWQESEKSRKRASAHVDRIESNRQEIRLYLLGAIVSFAILITILNERDYDIVDTSENKKQATKEKR